MKGIFLILAVTTIASCATVNREVAETVPGLREVEILEPGRTSKEEIRKAFGNPAEITDLNALPGANGRKDLGELWEYREIDVHFKTSSNILYSWTWHVPEMNPAQDLKVAMKQFPSASWEPQTDKWINPHVYPNQCYFEDKRLGISIEYNRLRKEVFTITRYDPVRALASQEREEEPPKYCIARDPNLCTPAIPAKEFFKNLSLSVSEYCKIP